jgi:hypothetical protein
MNETNIKTYEEARKHNLSSIPKSITKDDKYYSYTGIFDTKKEALNFNKSKKWEPFVQEKTLIGWNKKTRLYEAQEKYILYLYLKEKYWD